MVKGAAMPTTDPTPHVVKLLLTSREADQGQGRHGTRSNDRMALLGHKVYEQADKLVYV